MRTSGHPSAPARLSGDAGCLGRPGARFAHATAIFQALSLDIVLGVLAGALLAVHWTGASMPAAFWWVLPAATWAIYAVDRLFDASRCGAATESFRHRFHHVHAGRLWGHAACALAAVGIGSLWLLPPSIVLAGLLLAAASAIYLALAQRVRAPAFVKEIVAAAVYTCGIWFAPILLGHDGGMSVALVVGLHFLGALANLTVYGLFEIDIDRSDGHGSIATAWGERAAQRLVGWVAAFGITGAVIVGVRFGSGTAVVMGGVIVLPWVMWHFREFFAWQSRYRLWGDLAFLLLALPALVEILR